jgi:DNA-binding MarR family transcriptional regulator
MSREENLQRLAQAFLPIMHIVHQMALDVVRLTNFSLAQYRVLMLVYRQDSMSITQLKEYLHIAQSTASEMIERLVQQKTLLRENDPQDRRITLIRLTPRTRRFLQDHLASISNIYNKILDPLNPDEQLRLVEGFETILALLEKSHPQEQNLHKPNQKTNSGCDA